MAACLVLSQAGVDTVWAQDQPITREEARASFDEALGLIAAGDYTAALDKLQRAAVYKRTPQLRSNIALCYEKLGRLVQALGEYRIALADAEPSSDVAKEAQRAITALEPRIPTLAITLGENFAAAVVTVDGKATSLAAMEEGLAVDPGVRVVEAHLAGYANFRREVRLSEAEHETVEVQLVKRAPVASPPASTPLPATTATVAPPAPSEGRSVMTTAGWVVTGIGAASLGVSAYFYSRRASSISALEAVCGAGRKTCPASAHDTYTRGKSDTIIGNATLGLGLAGVLTGVILVLSGEASSERNGAPTVWTSKAIRVTPPPPGSWAGLGFDGSF